MEKTVEKLLLNDSMNDYLTFSKYINGNDVRIVSKANEFKQKYTNEIFGINSKNEYDAIEITAGSIVLKNGGAAKAIADWTAVASVDFYKSSAYIVTHDGYLFIINESDIKEGSLDELRQIADEKLVKTDD